MVLPVAVLNRTLREQGWERPDAIRTVHHAFLTTGDTQRGLFVLLTHTRLGARLLLRTLRPNWLGLTPPGPTSGPSPDPRPTPRCRSRCPAATGSTRSARLGTPAVAFIACNFEGFVMESRPTSGSPGMARLRVPRAATSASRRAYRAGTDPGPEN